MGPIEKPVNLLPQFSEEKKFDYNKTIDGLRQSTARLFNFDLMKNFNYPYFSRNIAEFWRRWHISLTQWLTVYVFLPIQMEFRDLRVFGNGIAIIATFIICGLWHGANWTFIIWGILNGIYLILFVLFNKGNGHLDIIINNRFLPSIRELFQIITTFSMTVFAWIFFRSLKYKLRLSNILGEYFQCQ